MALNEQKFSKGPQKPSETILRSIEGIVRILYDPVRTNIESRAHQALMLSHGGLNRHNFGYACSFALSLLPSASIGLRCMQNVRN